MDESLKNRLLGMTSLPAMARAQIAAGDLGTFDTATLLEVLYAPQNAPDLAGFWLQFFPRTINFDTMDIRFDIEDLNEFRLAPFVAPNVQGRVMRERGYTATSFRPAYVKPKHVIDPARSIPRRAGEAPGGTLSLAQRFDAIVADNLRRERIMIENRWDWMAARAMIDGSVTVVGEDYPSVTVDFGRDSSLTGVLSGTATWDNAGAAPMTDIGLFRQRVAALSRGPVTRLIFGLDAWNAFTQPNHTDVQRLLDALRRGGASDFNTAGLTDGLGVERQGTIRGSSGGTLELYTYANYYDPGDGSQVPYMGSWDVLGIGTLTTGVRCFGAIMDKRAGLLPLDMFPKQWDEEDPSVSYTMTQSAPLMVPFRPNNSFKLTVGPGL